MVRYAPADEHDTLFANRQITPPPPLSGQEPTVPADAMLGRADLQISHRDIRRRHRSHPPASRRDLTELTAFPLPTS
jgi:hypothetical protein